MSRLTGRFLQVIVFAMLISALPNAMHAGEVPTKASSTDRVVFPTGQFPADLENVRSAVNLGGTVLLKATNAAGQPTAFNFGAPKRLMPRQGIYITTEVSILGEQVGDQMTTIRGGYFPIRGLAPVRSRIQGIHFDGPCSSAIIIIRSTGSDIIGNRVSGVVHCGTPQRRSEGRGIKFLGNNDPNGAITGLVRVADNVIEDMHEDLSEGIVFHDVAADIEITGNRIHTVQSNGMLIISSKGGVLIEDNVVVPGPGDPAPEFSFGNGILIVDYRGASYIVRNNTVICENPRADGIFVMERASTATYVIEQNKIEMKDSLYSAIRLYGGITNAAIGRNVVTGTGAFAFGVFGFSSPPLQASTIQSNNISRFTPSVADVFLDEFTRDTVLVGYSGTVIDLGLNNQITGFTKIGHGQHIGAQIRDSQARKQEALSETFQGEELEE